MSTARMQPPPSHDHVTPDPLTAEQAFLRDAVRDVQWARRGLLGGFVRRAGT